MGKDHELLQAVKTEDLLTVQKLLQRPRPGKAIRGYMIQYLHGTMDVACIYGPGVLPPSSPAFITHSFFRQPPP
ncbi:hypothetical protein NHX12_031645 [Muraenolepis orangiensis]|uniref:Uncharacterized protein n=1 Tax=Muraenolepis orangiensis TaxID=630683 RepID=A0A9Q0E4D2_9TELE|nr:hypothetical protein NHX12_031645 [Muraenolepis orangiensis]